MRPVVFRESQVAAGQGQPEFLPMPIHRSRNGIVTSCWQLSDAEIDSLVRWRKMWVQTQTGNGLIQPIKLSVDQPELDL